MDRLMQQILDDNSCLNRIARIIIAGAVIILTLMIIAKFMTGQWSL